MRANPQDVILRPATVHPFYPAKAWQAEGSIASQSVNFRNAQSIGESGMRNVITSVAASRSIPPQGTSGTALRLLWDDVCCSIDFRMRYHFTTVVAWMGITAQD